MTQATQVFGTTLCTAKAGLAAGTTTTYTRAADVEGSIGGKFATPLSSGSNTASPTTDYNGDAFTAQAASTVCVYVYSIVAAGTIAVHQGSVETMDVDAVVVASSFPSIDLETYLPFGYVVIQNGSTGSAWTIGTSNWTATGVLDTFTDVTVLPSRPQSA